jgi:hypothetical protein
MRYGRAEGVTAVFPGGRTEILPLSALDDLVTERGNPDNSKNLSSVTVSADARLLGRGVELVDTPGTDSVYEHNTAEGAHPSKLTAAVSARGPAEASGRGGSRRGLVAEGGHRPQ